MAKWKEIKKYLIGEIPEGWFFPRERISERAALLSSMLMGLTTLLFVWVAVNAPVKTTEVVGKEVVKAGGMKWRWLGMVYAVMGGIAIALIGIEMVSPEKFRVVATPMLSPGDWSMLEVVVVGIAIAAGTMLFSSLTFATTGTLPFAFEVFPKIALINWMVVGLMIPIIEEAFFGCVYASSFTEHFGLLVGLTIPSFIFAIFHWGVYGLSVPLLLPIFLFRTLATLSMVFSRSWLPGLAGHMVINTASVMTVF